MMVRRRQAVLTTVLLLVVVFSIGVVVGNTWRTGTSSEIARMLRSSELEAESFLVEQELFESFDANCALAEKRLTALTGDLGKLGKVLGAGDARARLGDEEYDFLKRKYHLSQIRNFVLDRKLQTDCQGSVDVILYYFKQGDPLSEQQGRILDDLVQIHKNLHVFAVELGYSPELEFLEDYYMINRTPALVINYDAVVEGLATKEELSPLLHG